MFEKVNVKEYGNENIFEILKIKISVFNKKS